MLTDPTAGAGYSFGQILPSAHLTTIATQQPDALDGITGGTYGLTADILLNSTGTINFSVLPKTSVTLAYPQPLFVVGSTTFGGGNDWIVTNTYDVEQNYNDVTGANDPAFVMPLTHVPDNSTLQAVQIGLIAAGGHGSLPAELPKFEVFRTNLSTGVTASIGGPATDASGTVGAYEAFHTITVSSIAEAINWSSTPTRYQIRVIGESGSNSATGLKVQGCVASFDTTRINP